MILIHVRCRYQEAYITRPINVYNERKTIKTEGGHFFLIKFNMPIFTDGILYSLGQGLDFVES